MAGKSDYKKVIQAWGRKERKEYPGRKIEDNTMTAAASEVSTRYKKKAKRKKGSRSSHKHEYEIVLVKDLHSYESIKYSIRRICRICGRRDANFWRKVWLGGEYSMYKKTIKNGRTCYMPMTEEEILEKYGNLPFIEINQ